MRDINLPGRVRRCGRPSTAAQVARVWGFLATTWLAKIKTATAENCAISRRGAQYYAVYGGDQVSLPVHETSGGAARAQAPGRSRAEIQSRTPGNSLSRDLSTSISYWTSEYRALLNCAVRIRQADVRERVRSFFRLSGACRKSESSKAAAKSYEGMVAVLNVSLHFVGAECLGYLL